MVSVPRKSLSQDFSGITTNAATLLTFLVITRIQLTSLGPRPELPSEPPIEAHQLLRAWRVSRVRPMSNGLLPFRGLLFPFSTLDMTGGVSSIHRFPQGEEEARPR